MGAPDFLSYQTEYSRIYQAQVIHNLWVHTYASRTHLSIQTSTESV